MMRMLGLLTLIMFLTACSSGVSTDGAGGAGSDDGGTGLVIFATISPNSISSDAFPDAGEDADMDGIPDTLGTISTDQGTVSITVSDPFGIFSRNFQGVTFERYTVSYFSSDPAAPPLSTKAFNDTLNIVLNNGQGVGTLSIFLVDLPTKAEFRRRASGSTVFNYDVTVTITGRDFINNATITVVVRTTIEMGDFVDNAGEGDG